MKNKKMKKFTTALAMFLAVLLIPSPLTVGALADKESSTGNVLYGYDEMTASSDPTSSASAPASPIPAQETTPSTTPPPTVATNGQIGPYIPNESGEVMILMFHHFIEAYTGGDRKITITLDGFSEFLQTIYDQGYRPVSMNDFLNNTISIPKGYRPIVLTFDDGWASQFSLIEVDGKYQTNPNTAVGVMEQFNREHPDFELKGTFFVNLGQGVFGKTGTVSERLNYLVNEGFEIGNHGYKHNSFAKMDGTGIAEEIGQNQATMDSYIPGYKFSTLALPYGSNNREQVEVISAGTYEGVTYDNQMVFLAGWKPTEIPGTTEATFVTTRIVAPSLEPVDMDASWWLKDAQKNPSRYYVSDGDPNVITVPENKVDLLTEHTCFTRKIVTTPAI